MISILLYKSTNLSRVILLSKLKSNLARTYFVILSLSFFEHIICSYEWVLSVLIDSLKIEFTPKVIIQITAT